MNKQNEQNEQHFREVKHQNKHDKPNCISSVPEPNTFLMFGLGILILGFILKRNINKFKK